MHNKATAAPFEEDDAYEQAVLQHVLYWQPTILRMRDLIREVRPVPSDTESRDAVGRAVRELIKVNLLHKHGECVLPTTTAVYVRGMDLG